MNSKQVLALHAALFATLLLGSLALSYHIYTYPDTIPLAYLVMGTIVLGVPVAGSFVVYGGCVFTIWENQLRGREGRPKYPDSCVRHYAREWFGITLPKRGSALVLLLFLLLPMLTMLMRSFV